MWVINLSYPLDVCVESSVSTFELHFGWESILFLQDGYRSIISWTYIQVVACINSSFLFYGWVVIPQSGCTSVCLTIYLLKDIVWFYVVVQLLSRVQLFVTPRTAAHQAPLSSTVSWSLLTFMSIELVMPSHHLILCYLLFLLLPSIFPSNSIFSIK